MFKDPRSFFRLLAIAACCGPVAQDLAAQGGGGARIEIQNADKWTFDDKLARGAQRLLGNVRFSHEHAVMTCDSAYVYEDQTVDAFGRINIDQGDTLHITGERLHYDGAARMATIDGNVRMSDRDMDLVAPHITYDLRKRVATYTGGGTLTSRKENNTLTSGHGSYIAAAHQFRFHDDVVLRGPDRTITSDSLYYTSTTGVAQFVGPTSIISGDTRMWCTQGTYDTRNDRGRFTQRARVLSGGQELLGDSLHYDRKRGEGLAWGNVLLIDTANGLVVRGDEGRYAEQAEKSMVTGHAELEMRMGADTLWLHGDTLLALPDTVKGKRRITALHRVRFFKSDLQGACDTMRYADTDSTIHLLSRPVLWSAKDQITGTRMHIALRDGKAHRLFVEGDAFITSVVDSTHYDQVTGTTLTGYFADGALDHLITEGNCRTVYFAREERTKTDTLQQVMGLNRADCSRIQVRVIEDEVNEITFLTKPDGVYYPIKSAPEEEMRLKGFAWRGEERPETRTEIFP